MPSICHIHSICIYFLFIKWCSPLRGSMLFLIELSCSLYKSLPIFNSYEARVFNLTRYDTFIVLKNFFFEVMTLVYLKFKFLYFICFHMQSSCIYSGSEFFLYLNTLHIRCTEIPSQWRSYLNFRSRGFVGIFVHYSVCTLVFNCTEYYLM